jgi:hypothetical protein
LSQPDALFSLTGTAENAESKKRESHQKKLKAKGGKMVFHSLARTTDSEQAFCRIAKNAIHSGIRF